MGTDKKAEIVAFARLLGVDGSDEEIIERYSAAYEKAYVTFSSEPVKLAKAEITRGLRY